MSHPKILFYTYPWAFDVAGGGERQLQIYANSLKNYDVESECYDMWHSRIDNFQIFHCFSVMPSCIDMCDYAKQKGLKLVISPNLWITKETVGNYPSDQIWNMFELADKILVNSNMEGDQMSSVFGFPRDKFKTIYNGADSDFMIPADPSIFKNKFNLVRPFILNVANIEPRKNQLAFINALRITKPDLDFVIVGEVRDEAYAAKCKIAGGDHIKYVGSLPYASALLRSAIAGCEFFAMPSLLETPSIAAIEAACAGAKILLTNIGSTHEYFGDSVTYVDPLSPSSLSSGIQNALTSSPDKSTWASRNRFLWPSILPDLSEFYQTLI